MAFSNSSIFTTTKPPLSTMCEHLARPYGGHRGRHFADTMIRQKFLIFLAHIHEPIFGGQRGLWLAYRGGRGDLSILNSGGNPPS